MTYRSDLDALAARHTALESELSAKTKELEQASRLLDEARVRAKLPVLDNIRIASPCKADWSKMTGDERARHCHQCDKQVFDISQLTRAEAEALIAEKAGKLCARYYQRSDGTILLKDCTIGAAAARTRKVVVATTAAVLATTIAFGMKHRESPVCIDLPPSPPESATGHVHGTVSHEAPPPPVPHKPVHVEPEHEHVKLMGDVAFTDHDL